MAETVTSMPRRKRIALIAHDNCKNQLLEWARFNRGTLGTHELHATGTTGALLATELGLEVHRFLSGPLGGGSVAVAAPQDTGHSEEPAAPAANALSTSRRCQLIMA